MFLWPVFRRVQNLRHLQISCSRDRRCWAANTSRKSDPLRFPLPSGPRSSSLTPERLCRTTQGLTHHLGPALLSGKKQFYIPLKSFSWFCEETSCWDIQRCIYNILETCYFCSLQKDKEQERLLNKNNLLRREIHSLVTKSKNQLAYFWQSHCYYPRRDILRIDKTTDCISHLCQPGHLASTQKPCHSMTFCLSDTIFLKK